MGPKNVGVIRIALNAGTAEFLADMDKANARLTQFGRSAKSIDLETPMAKAGQMGRELESAGSHGVSGVQAVSGALRVMEGGITNNLRAAERFTANVLGLGPILQAAFPLIGAIAFLGIIVKVGEEVHKQYAELRDYPEKLAGGWRDVQAPLQKTNDELDLANIKLKNQVAVLEGRHQNTLAAALHAAKVEADDLAESLKKDLNALYSLFTETDKGFLQKIFTGTTSQDIRETIGGKAGKGGDVERIAEINRRGYTGINEAVATGNPDAVKAAQKKLDDELISFIDARQGWIAKQIAITKNFETGFVPKREVRTEDLVDKETGRVIAPKGSVHFTGDGGAGEGVRIAPGPPQTDRLADLNNFNEYMGGMKSEVLARRMQSDLKGQIGALEGAKTDARPERPFDNKMAELKASLAGVEEKLNAIGKGEQAKIIAEAFGTAAKSIEEVDKALSRINPKLKTTEDQQAQIKDIELRTAQTKAVVEWKTKLDAANTSITEQIGAQERLADAIGKGYEATRAANIETRVMQELGQHAGDPAWMKTHGDDVEKLRSGFGREFDAQHARASAETVDKLRDEIEMERELAAVQRDGAEAVRQATLAVRLRQLVAVGATKEQIQVELELYNVQRANVNAADVAKIEDRISATERLTAALLGGVEAERKAGLENKYDELKKQAGIAPGSMAQSETEIKERAADAADHQRAITAEALKSGLAYKNELDSITQQIAALEKIKAERGDALEIEIALRDLENRRLDALTKESLALGGARDGVRAFFIEMQRDGKRAADIVFESLNSALDKTSSSLAKLLTGQKANWGSTFREIGEQMAQSSIKSMAQKGLGAIGKKFGIDLGGTKPDGTASNPIWVRIAGTGAGVPGATPGAHSGLDLGGLFGGGSKGGGIFSFIGSLFGKSGGAAAAGGEVEDVSSSIDFGGVMGSGGMVSPDKAYIVGDRGTEILTGASGRIVSNSELSRTFGGGGRRGGDTYIDARGADLGARNRIARGMEMTRRASVATSVQAVHERSRRVPAHA
jgi:hypothetical protein